MPGKIAESSLPQIDKNFIFQKEFFKGFFQRKISKVASADFQRFFSKDFSHIDFKPDNKVPNLTRAHNC
jgi:hypothetical protein